MAQLSRRGKVSWTGEALSYIAIDGTEFRRGKGTRASAKQRAIEHSRQLLANRSLTLEGTQLFSRSGRPLGEDWGAALGALGIEATEQAREKEFEGRYGELRGLIERGGAETQERLTTQAARSRGALSRAIAEFGAGRGEDPEKIQALIGRAGGQQQRTLQDALMQSRAYTTGQLAQAAQYEIGTEAGFEQMGQHMQQFLMNQQLQREKYQAMLDIQPEWWEQMLGGFGSGIGSGVGMLATAWAANKFKGWGGGQEQGAGLPGSPYTPRTG